MSRLTLVSASGDWEHTLELQDKSWKEDTITVDGMPVDYCSQLVYAQYKEDQCIHITTSVSGRLITHMYKNLELATSDHHYILTMIKEALKHE